MKTILIIPCFNDNDSIKILLDQIHSIDDFDILIIDDGSLEEVRIDNENPKISIIRNSINKGKGYSLKKGFNYAYERGYTHAITLDADLQHDPKFISKFLAIDENINIVIGARIFNHAMPFHRKFSNKITSYLTSKLAGKKILDSQSGFRRYNLKNKSYINCKEDGFQFESEILINDSKFPESRVEHIDISTIYNDEKSSINNMLDTYKFVRLIVRKIFDR